MKKTILSTLCFLLVSCFMFFTDAGTRIVVLGSSTAAGAGVSDSNAAIADDITPNNKEIMNSCFLSITMILNLRYKIIAKKQHKKVLYYPITILFYLKCDFSI